MAHADAAAELPLALTALGGSIVTSSGRTIPAGDFFVTHFTTALEPGELLVETLWPVAEPGRRYAFEEVAQRHGDFALCMAAAVSGPDGLRVALGSVVDRPTLLSVDPERPGEPGGGHGVGDAMGDAFHHRPHEVGARGSAGEAGEGAASAEVEKW